jgi:hypothetical protein
MKIRRTARVAGWAGLGAVIALCALPAVPASAATLDGTATIINPSNNATLSSGGSETVFALNLTPAPAYCSGNTSNNGYHEYTYLVPQGTNIALNSPLAAGGAGISFAGSQPSEGYGLISNLYGYGTYNTANNDQVSNIPTDFEFADLVTEDSLSANALDNNGTSEVWEAGIVCANSSGAVTDYWNTVVTFTASGSDPNGFKWSAVAGPDPATPEVAWAVTLPITGAVVLGGGLWFTRRRSRRKALLAHQTAG